MGHHVVALLRCRGRLRTSIPQGAGNWRWCCDIQLFGSEHRYRLRSFGIEYILDELAAWRVLTRAGHRASWARRSVCWDV